MSNQPGRVEGRVAAILNARELAINIGRKHGVCLGMKFAVLAETPLEIRDPISGEVLDAVDREKVRVETTELRERISICRTYRVRTIPGGPLCADLTNYVVGLADLTRPSHKIT